ncbi:peptidoglycan DD-metalloendopeptidase family protein [Streptomyces sp. NPDC006172]|uniref:M23 family metallopeptidase n=1 Tax=Streptomyces sp. NPDC006172 TaxID=3154470 RepID=UPI0033EFF28F
MRSSRRRLLLVPVLLCVPALLAAGPISDGAEPGGDGAGAEVGAGVQVARLYEDAAVASRMYEAGRLEAEARRAEVQRLEALLTGRRQEIAALREELGRIARAQYRTGGELSATAHGLLVGGPDAASRSRRSFARMSLDVDMAIGESRRAEARLAADEAKAADGWQAMEQSTLELASLKADIEQKLEQARGQLQGEADISVAAGSCRGAERLDGGPVPYSGAWVTPVEGYTLSASFGSGGEHWANRHTGQDFAVPIGTPVRAVGAGRVVRVACGGAFGIEIVLEHNDGYYTQYAHLAAVTVDQGESVSPGQLIGQSGTSGNSTGPHLHFEARVTPDAGSAVDPVPWLGARGAPVGR